MYDIYSDGWRRFSGSWEYVAANSFKTEGDHSSVLRAGARVRYTQIVNLLPVTYYSVVDSVSYNSTTNLTTVVLLPGSVTIANGSISSPSYSYEAVPQGYPGFGGDIKCAKVALTPGNANAIAFAWQNPEAVQIIVHKVMIHRVTAGGTGSSVLDVGAVNAPTDTADTIIDGLDLNATGLADNIADKGTNGTTRSVLMTANGGALDHITGKILVANAASLAGYAYIYYTKI